MVPLAIVGVEDAAVDIGVVGSIAVLIDLDCDAAGHSGHVPSHSHGEEISVTGGRAIAHDIEIALLLGSFEPKRDGKLGGAELADRLAEIDMRRTARLQLYCVAEAVAAGIRAAYVRECSARRPDRVVRRIAAGFAKDEAVTIHRVLSPTK